MKPTKHSIAFIVYTPDRSQVLAVQRPADDEELPNLWGLPATSLKPGESEEQAVVRAGNEKLGVGLQVVGKIATGTLERTGYVLHLTDYEAAIVSGAPNCPQSGAGTQYAAWKWADPKELIPAAQKGSLCTRLFLEEIGMKC